MEEPELCVLWPWRDCAYDCPPCPDRARRERVWRGIQAGMRDEEAIVIERIFRKVWETTWVKETVLLIATAVAVVLVAQLQALDQLFDDGASLDELRVWAESAAAALGVTAIRQAIAVAIARLAGKKL